MLKKIGLVKILFLFFRLLVQQSTKKEKVPMVFRQIYGMHIVFYIQSMLPYSFECQIKSPNWENMNLKQIIYQSECIFSIFHVW